jgi:hypothetical protein
MCSEEDTDDDKMKEGCNSRRIGCNLREYIIGDEYLVEDAINDSVEGRHKGIKSNNTEREHLMIESTFRNSTIKDYPEAVSHSPLQSSLCL